MWRLTVRWGRQGEVKWEEWWTREHGESLERDSSQQEHVGFANYDLAQNGLPELVSDGEGLFTLPLIPEARLQAATDVLAYHGFVVESSERI
jgi:hypothetical protein